MQEKEPENKGEKSMSGCGAKDKLLTGEQVRIVEEIAETRDPCGSKDISAATGLESEIISSTITALKKKGLVV